MTDLSGETEGVAYHALDSGELVQLEGRRQYPFAPSAEALQKLELPAGALHDASVPLVIADSPWAAMAALLRHIVAVGTMPWHRRDLPGHVVSEGVAAAGIFDVPLVGREVTLAYDIAGQDIDGMLDLADAARTLTEVGAHVRFYNRHATPMTIEGLKNARLADPVSRVRRALNISEAKRLKKRLSTDLFLRAALAKLRPAELRDLVNELPAGGRDHRERMLVGAREAFARSLPESSRHWPGVPFEVLSGVPRTTSAHECTALAVPGAPKPSTVVKRLLLDGVGDFVLDAGRPVTAREILDRARFAPADAGPLGAAVNALTELSVSPAILMEVLEPLIGTKVSVSRGGCFALRRQDLRRHGRVHWVS